jgi:hypothetical protein
MSKIPGADWIRRRLRRTSTEMMDDIARIDVRKWMDPQQIRQEVRARDFDSVDGVVVEAEIDRYTVDALRSIRRIIDDNYRVMPTLLIGVDYSTRGLRDSAEVFDATVAVSPDRRELIDRLEPHYPKLLEHVGRFGELGSVRVNSFPLVDERILKERMRNEIGDQLHDLADQAFPTFYAYRAPGSFADAAENVLGEMGHVVSRQHTGGQGIEVLGFVFDVDEAYVPEEGLRDPLGGSDLGEADAAVSPASVFGPERGQADDGGTDQLVHRDLGDGEDSS